MERYRQAQVYQRGELMKVVKLTGELVLGSRCCSLRGWFSDRPSYAPELPRPSGLPAR
jgi:hypothetical protein